MIKYNNNTINEWNYGSLNLIKVYRNNAIVFYKVMGASPTYDLCYAVVDDISQYQETDFEDVFNKADRKWYKLNNLNDYEEYGVYGSGRNITTYEGKLTVDGGYEYEWNGSSWVNLGEVSGASKTSDFKIGDIKERVTTGVSNGDYLLFSYYRNSDISKPQNIMSYKPSDNSLSNLSGYGITSIDSTTIIDPSIWLLESTASANTFYIKSIKNNLYWGYQSRVSSTSLNLVDGSSNQKAPVLITPSCKENCYGFVEKKSNASTGYGGYGLNQLFGRTYQFNWWNNGSSNDPCNFFGNDGNSDFIIYKMNNAGGAKYPIYYTEKADPLDNLVFSTMEEANAYAYNNCVYDGMIATINGNSYIFDSENGWVITPFKYRFTLSDSSVVAKPCDSTLEITSADTTNYIGTLAEAEIFDCVEVIDNATFSGCTNLSSVTIPNSVEVIGNGAFDTCNSLSSVTIPNSVEVIGRTAFSSCSNLRSVNIPSGVTSIGNTTFFWCSSLSSITIPSGVTSIGNNAFQGCNSLNSITVEATTPPTLGSYAFDYTNECPILVPSESVDTYKAASGWSTYADRIQAIPTP